MRFLQQFRVFIASISLLFTGLSAEAIAPPMDYVEATEFCDRADLQLIEGLWTYPEDDVTVLIFRNEDQKGIYDIFIVEAASCALKAGMKLGELHSSVDPDKFTLKLFTSVKNGILSSPCEASATFSESKESLTVKKSSVKIRINPMRLLPSFWRLASISIKSPDPAPEGMIKIYPSYDGNNSTRRGPRYL